MQQEGAIEKNLKIHSSAWSIESQDHKPYGLQFP